MSKKCLICNSLHLEMMTVFQHPNKQLHSMLQLLLGLQAKQKDYLCKICSDKVINEFNSKKKCQKSDLRQQKELTKHEIEPNEPNEVSISTNEFEMKIEPKTDNEFEGDFETFEMNAESKELKENVEEKPETHENVGISVNYKSEIANKNGKFEEDFRIVNQSTDSSHSLEYFKKESSIDIESFDEESNNGAEKIFTFNDSSKLKGQPKKLGEVVLDSISQKPSIQTNTKEKPYVCPNCGKSFVNSADLKRHKRTHTGERPFACSYCSKTFSDYSNHRAHVRTHVMDKTFTCSDCGKSFITSTRLKEHKRMHTSERPYACRYCSKTYVRGSNLRVHVRSHMKEKPYACSECKKSFTTSTDLKRHKRTHAEERQFKCLYCTKNFKSSSILRNHERKHTNEIDTIDSKVKFHQSNLQRPDVMRIDRTVFKNETDAVDQTEITTISRYSPQVKIEPKNDDDLEDFKFPTVDIENRLEAGEDANFNHKAQGSIGTIYDNCGSVIEKEGLKEDIKFEPLYADSGQISREISDECQEYFKREKSVDIEDGEDEVESNGGTQEIFNTDEYSELKEYPKKGTVMLGSLWQNSPIQTQIKKKAFECCYCEKSFITSGDLKRHKRTHTGERPYACSYCFKTFSDYSNHRAHMRTHLKEKPYVCSECGKSFVTSTNLKSHKWTHTEERPYACNYCSKTFSDSSNRRRHVRTHMKEEIVHSDPTVL